jgi:sigma-B regulation protein RsbU (phosphoserine phosphatase)
MKRRLRILHLEDDLRDAELIREMLVSEGISCDIVRVDKQAAFLDALEQSGFELIFADYSLPAFDGISALNIAKEKSPETPFIFMGLLPNEWVKMNSKINESLVQQGV